MRRTVLAVASAGLVAACTSHAQVVADPDITKILDLKGTFGPDYQVKTVAPTGIDPRAFAPQTLPPGLKFEPPDCAKFSAGMNLPTDSQGNMSEMTAEGEGNSYILLAVETSAPVPFPEPGDACKKFSFTGPSLRGQVEVVEAPSIDGVRTLGTHRLVVTSVNGKAAIGELYTYVASWGNFMVVVIARPLLTPNTPTSPVNTGRARDLLTKAVAAVHGK